MNSGSLMLPELVMVPLENGVLTHWSPSLTAADRFVVWYEVDGRHHLVIMNGTESTLTIPNIRKSFSPALSSPLWRGCQVGTLFFHQIRPIAWSTTNGSLSMLYFIVSLIYQATGSRSQYEPRLYALLLSYLANCELTQIIRVSIFLPNSIEQVNLKTRQLSPAL